MKTLTHILSSLLLILALGINAHSQQIFKVANAGIGTVAPTEKLDVSGNIKFSGALMPSGNAGLAGNLLLSGGASPSSPTWFVNGTSAQALTYFGSSPLWVAIGYWNLTGNAGTNPAVDFIGTTDDQPLVFHTGGSNTYAGEIDPQFVGATLKGNTYMGEGSASNGAIGAGNNGSGTYNVAFGCGSLGQVTTGTGNVALAGFIGLMENTTGSYNVAIDYESLVNNFQGNGNVGIGDNTLHGQSGTTSYNTGIGDHAGYGYSPVGSTGTSTNGMGNFNVALGYQALYTNTADNASSNTALGSNALRNTTGKQNTAVGDSSLATNTTGNFNTALGYQSNVISGSLTNATAIGYNAAASVSNSITLGNTSDVGGATSATTTGLYIPGYNTVGSLFYTSAGTGHVAPLTAGTSGYFLQSNGAGVVPTWANIIPGTGLVTTITGTAPITVSGAWMVGVQGNSLGTDKGGVLYSAGAGTSALFTPTGTPGQLLTSTGTGAPIWAAPANASWSLTGNSGTVPGTNWIGTNDDVQLRFFTGAGSFGGAGPSGSIDPQFVGATTKGNTYLGDPNANNGNTTGAGNNDAGSYNVGIGLACMGFATATATYNTAMGTHALEPINAGAMSGSYNVSMGASSNVYNLSGNYETAVGWSAMAAGVYNSTVSNYNTAAGAKALSANSVSGTIFYHAFNTAVGYSALFTPSAGAANSITAVGSNAAYQSTGNRNTAVGDSALYTNTSGTNNTAIGYFANVASAALTNSIAIGSKSVAPVSNSVTLGISSPATNLYLPGYNAIGSLFYTSATSGLVSPTGAGTSTYLLQSNGPGVAPAWANVTIGGSGSVTNVTGTAPIVVTGSWNVGIQGTALDKGGVLYSTGAGSSALFTPTPASAALILTSSAAGAAPTWTALANSVWNLTGNAGTTPGTNFIGTTDANRLAFKVDNVVAGTIDLPTTNVPPGNGNVYLGYQVLSASNLATNTADAGTNNVAVGFESFTGTGTRNVFLGGNNTATVTPSGNDNIGVGFRVLFDLTTGSGNTTVSPKGAHSIVSGNYNTAFGYSSMANANFNSAGNYNVAIGRETLNDAVSGAFFASSTAVGFQSQGGNLLGHNTSLGAWAMEGNTAGWTNTYGTAIGDSALTFTTVVLSGTYNTALGWFAKTNVVGLTNTTAVGARSLNAQNNSLVLGSINGLSGTVANTNVGIGTNAPASDASLAVKTGHLETQGQLSSGNIVLGSGAGTGGSAGTSINANGATDVGGQISITTGTTGLGTGSQATVSFAKIYTYSPIIVISPANAAAAAAMTVNGAYTTSNTSNFSINFNSAPAASTTYNFNYYAVETPGTSPVFIYPSYTETCVVPITITNGTTAIAAGTTQFNGYQQMISVNSSLYTNENATLNNIVFTTAAPVAGVTQGTVLEAWIESGATSSSNPTVYWVNLGTTGIAASGTLTIYMNIVTANVLSATGPTGEAPQLSGTYAQLDNGSLVFNNYWNFAGTSIPAGLTSANATGGTIVYNNGVTITPVSAIAWGTYVATASKISAGNVAESYFKQVSYPASLAAQALLGGMIVDANQTLTGTNSSYAASIDLQTTRTATGLQTVPFNTWLFEIQNSYNQGSYPYPVLGFNNIGTTGNTSLNIWSLGINPTGTLGFGDVNYTNLVAGGSSTENLSSGFYIGLSLTQLSATYQWLRTRTYPPGGVMPTIGFSAETCP